MFIDSRKEGDRLIEVATAEDKASAKKLIRSLSMQWPAEYKHSGIRRRAGPKMNTLDSTTVDSPSHMVTVNMEAVSQVCPMG
jgi:hypothetical protein